MTSIREQPPLLATVVFSFKQLKVKNENVTYGIE